MHTSHYDLLIATPGIILEAQYVKSLVATLEECNRRNISVKWLNAYSSLVHHARELTTTGGEGLELDPLHKGPVADSVTYNKMFWIDSDIAWTPEQFFALYDAPEAIISGAYLLANGLVSTIQTNQYPKGMPKETIKSLKSTVVVDSIGFGFVAIKSGVFEKMQRPWFKHHRQKIQTGSNTFIEDSVGEDISWCINAKNNGFEIHFDPKVLVNHIKKTTIGWD